jgi:fructokinase
MRIDQHARTTLAFIAMPDEHTAEFVFYRNPGADLMLRPEELDARLLRGARALHTGSLSLVEEPARAATHEAARLAREGGALISFDVNFRPSLWENPAQALEQIWTMVAEADLLKVNETEVRLLAGQNEDLPAACRMLVERGPELILVTLGPRGSFFYTTGSNGFVPAFPVRTVDATGCGDAFMGGLLSRLVSAGDWRSRLAEPALREDVRFANATGALTALKQGVIPALPAAAQVEAFLKENQTSSIGG